jgi:hypothetical protein
MKTINALGIHNIKAALTKAAMAAVVAGVAFMATPAANAQVAFGVHVGRFGGGYIAPRPIYAAPRPIYGPPVYVTPAYGYEGPRYAGPGYYDRRAWDHRDWDRHDRRFER